jgi:hypothetical protein
MPSFPPPGSVSRVSKPQPSACTGLLAMPRFRDERLDVGAHQTKLVNVVLVGRMNCHFRRRQSKDQPATPTSTFGSSSTSLGKARSASGLVL